MDYFEELGLPRSATPEQIHQAYKLLTRLLHPDRYPDERLRRLAECQMKRLHQVLEVLTDPEQRRLYELMLEAGPPRGAPVVQPPIWRYAQEWVVWLVVAGIGVGITAWYWHSGSTPYPGRVPTTQAQPAPKQSWTDHSKPAMASSLRSAPARSAAADLRRRLEAAEAERDEAVAALARWKQKMAVVPDPPMIRTTKEWNALPTMADNPPVTIRPGEARGEFSGDWYYAHQSSEGSEYLYPPEYIEVVITEEKGRLSGRYRARYRVSDRAISPEVVFEFGGEARPPAVLLPWTAGNGARGELRLRLLSADSMELNWWTTRLSAVPALASGTAMLTRRREF